MPRSEWTRGSSCCAEDGLTLEKFLEPLVESDAFQALLARPGDRLGRAEAPGHPYAAAALAVAVDASVLAVLPGPREAKSCADGAEAFLGPERVALFPAWEALPVEGISPSPETVARRARAARLLRSAKGPTVVTAPVAAVVQRLVPSIGRRGPLRLAAGDEIAPDRLAERLVGLGYVRSDLAVHRGELAVRGGIVDVFPGAAARPARIEFVGDEVERIRTFSPATQLTERPVDALEIDPVRELLPDEEVQERARMVGPGRKGRLRDVLSRIEEGLFFGGMEQAAPLLFDHLPVIADLVPDGGWMAGGQGWGGPDRLGGPAEGVGRPPPPGPDRVRRGPGPRLDGVGRAPGRAAGRPGGRADPGRLQPGRHRGRPRLAGAGPRGPRARRGRAPRAH